MKNLIFTAAAVLAFGFANAQSENDSAKTFGFAENDIFVEGNLGFTSTDNKNTNAKTNSVQFSPKVSYFISENVAIGVQVGVGSAKGELNGVDVSKSSSFNAGVFGRYYFLELGKRFKTYGSANIDFGSAKSGLGNAEVKSNGTSVYHYDELMNHKDDIDVLVLCGSSERDLRSQSPDLAQHFNIVDSFDMHAITLDHVNAVDEVAKANMPCISVTFAVFQLLIF